MPAKVHDERTPLKGDSPTQPQNLSSSLYDQGSVSTICDNTTGLDSSDPSRNSESDDPLSGAKIKSIVIALLFGEFVSNADATFVMATIGPVSSQFNRMQDGNWLFTGYSLGACVAQPLYGKLSDIYGRSPLLLASYLFLSLGCVICGMAHSMNLVIFGRVMRGVGGAGVMAFSSIIITDLVPKREIASWRSYVNIAMTLGRSAGGPLGGWLTDLIGWRWAFLLQSPLLCLAALLVFIRMSGLRRETISAPKIDGGLIKRVDILGTALLSTSIVALIIVIDCGGRNFPWLSYMTLVLAAVIILAFVAFIYVEVNVAPEPILDLKILSKPNVATSYLASSFQTAAQVSMMFAVPIYFQVTRSVSSTIAGAHLVPAVIANTIGGLLSGYLIKRTGRYKFVQVAAGLIGSLSYLLLFLRWDGRTGFWESLYIIPGGLGSGLSSSGFVSMTAFLEPEEIAMATSGFILLLNLFISASVTTTKAALDAQFQRQMEKSLTGPDAEQIIHHSLSDLDFISRLTGEMRETVVRCFIAGLKPNYIFSFVCCIIASAFALRTVDRRL